MKNETLVLIPLASGEYLALELDAFVEARRLGAALIGRDATPARESRAEEPLLTAEQIGERMNAPSSWFLEQARKNAIPHVKLGKYVRFRFSEVCDSRAQSHRNGEE